MKPILFIITILIFTLLGCNQTKVSITEKDIEGPWRVVLLKFVTTNSERVFIPGKSNYKEMKIWSKNYFVFAGVLNEFTSSGGGTYKLSGSSYEESYKYYPEANRVGKTCKMKLEILNDTMILTWPLNANGEIDKLNYNLEKLVRLK